MCGRFNIIGDPLTRLLMEITSLEYPLADRFNIAPTEQVPVVTRMDSAWGISEMRWWLVPRWAKEPSTRYSMFNAKAETLHESRAYQQSFRDRRCVIPVSGYYEWRTEAGRKVPYLVRPVEANGFFLAGLWDRWQRDGEALDSCTIVTTAADPRLDFLHHRMPVTLPEDALPFWLDEGYDQPRLASLLAPQLKVAAEVVPVSPYVNNSRNEGAECVAEAGSPRRIS